MDALALLQDLIRRPSVTPADEGVLALVEQALVPLGFVCTRMTFEGDGSYPVENLFATRAPVGRSHGRHLLFAGHTDVVPPGDAGLWTHPPFGAEVADGKVFGRGAADMKSGVAAFIAAAAAAVADGSADSGRISLAITNDEEADSINGTEKLMAWAAGQGHRFDFAIVGEPSATARVGDSIKVGRRGSLNGRITVTGVQGHVAYPDRAKNPLPVAAAIVAALSGKLDDGNQSFPPSNLEFTSVDVDNETTNVIPAEARLRFNVRYNDSLTPESLEAAIRQNLDNLDANGCRIAFALAGRPSRAFLCPQGEAVDTLVATIAALHGRGPELSTAGGTSDARFIAQYCPVVECGLPGPTMHKADEHIAIADLTALTGLYQAFIARYFAA
jgi:succinyl-diaminopimelate desuccinylase